VSDVVDLITGKVAAPKLQVRFATPLESLHDTCNKTEFTATLLPSVGETRCKTGFVLSASYLSRNVLFDVLRAEAESTAVMVIVLCWVGGMFLMVAEYVESDSLETGNRVVPNLIDKELILFASVHLNVTLQESTAIVVSLDGEISVIAGGTVSVNVGS
jgi:hypothetical protein